MHPPRPSLGGQTGGAAAVLVITDARSPRHAAVIGHLTRAGIAHEVSPAVFPEGESPWSRHYDEATRLRNLGYPMRRGEVGCFLAHRLAWETVVRRGLAAAVIIEDDARFLDGGARAAALTALAVKGKPWFVRLVSEPRPPFRPLARLDDDDRCLAYPTRPGDLTVGYVISLEGARGLLRHSERFWCPVDDYMNLQHVHGVIGLHLEPPAVAHDDGGASQIGERTKPRMGLVGKVSRELRRALRNLRLAISRERTLWRLGLRFRRPRPPDG